MKVQPLLRVVIFLVLFSTIFFLPWWCGVFLAIVCSVSIKKYGEVIILGSLSDCLYALPAATTTTTLFHMYPGTISALIAFGVIEYTRSKVFTVQ